MAKNLLSAYLRFITKTGLTRHVGGISLTDVFLKKVSLKKKAKVLDVGCGVGHTCGHLAQVYEDASITGVDISLDAIKNAKSNYEDISFITADACDLPFKDDSFDLVICESVLIFIKDKEKALKEMIRVLKKDGYLLLNELVLINKNLEVKKYFAKQEMKAYIEEVQDFEKLLDSFDLSLVIRDEHGLNYLNQIMADIRQFGLVKLGFMSLETIYKIFLDEEVKKDFISLLKLLKDKPENLMKDLGAVSVLFKK